MRTSTKIGVGVGAAAVIGGGVYYYKFYKLPNKSGYQKLGLAKSQWGATACQVRDPATLITSSKAANLCGTVYLMLGPALNRRGGQFTPSTGQYAGHAQYGVARMSRSSSSGSWTVNQVYLTSTSNSAGDYTGGSTCS